MPPYVGMARKQNGGYNASISVQMPIFHLVVNSTRLKTDGSFHIKSPKLLKFKLQKSAKLGTHDRYGKVNTLMK